MSEPSNSIYLGIKHILATSEAQLDAEMVYDWFVEHHKESDFDASVTQSKLEAFYEILKHGTLSSWAGAYIVDVAHIVWLEKKTEQLITIAQQAAKYLYEMSDSMTMSDRQQQAYEGLNLQLAEFQTSYPGENLDAY